MDDCRRSYARPVACHGRQERWRFPASVRPEGHARSGRLRSHPARNRVRRATAPRDAVKSPGAAPVAGVPPLTGAKAVYEKIVPRKPKKHHEASHFIAVRHMIGPPSRFGRDILHQSTSCLHGHPGTAAPSIRQPVSKRVQSTGAFGNLDTRLNTLCPEIFPDRIA